MVKTRIKRWKLDKKLKFTDMRSAIQLMANSGIAGGAGAEPTFLVRGRVVPYSEALRYFHRKGITDPLTWLRSLPDDGFVPSSDVELLTPPTTEFTPDETDEDVGPGTELFDWVLLPSHDENLQELPLFPPDHVDPPASTPNEASGLEIMPIALPAQPYLSLSAEKVVHVIDNYCAMYLHSPNPTPTPSPQCTT